METAPDSQDPTTITLEDENATARLGERLANLAVPGAKVYLSGDLGAGKTTLVRAMLRALGVTGRIKSPTFAIVELYGLSKLSLYHFDFYRFEDPRELRDSGLLEHFAEEAFCVVEWPENAAGVLPAPDLEIRLEFASRGGRHARLSAHTERGRLWLKDEAS